jgi:hypothetical protein
MPAVDPYELQCALYGWSCGHIDVDVHPIDTLHFRRNVLAKDLGNRLSYAHRGSGCGCLYGQAIRLTAVPFNGSGLPFPPQCTQPGPFVDICS